MLALMDMVNAQTYPARLRDEYEKSAVVITVAGIKPD